jgi:hypothetical protein
MTKMEARARPLLLYELHSNRKVLLSEFVAPIHSFLARSTCCHYYYYYYYYYHYYSETMNAMIFA